MKPFYKGPAGSVRPWLKREKMRLNAKITRREKRRGEDVYGNILNHRGGERKKYERTILEER